MAGQHEVWALTNCMVRHTKHESTYHQTAPQKLHLKMQQKSKKSERMYSLAKQQICCDT